MTKDILTIFKALNEKYSNTFNYLISIENVGCWMGSTPELLLSIFKNKFSTVSIAGTKANENLAWGEKEIEEQKMVTDYIFSTLKKSAENVLKNGPFTIKAGTVEHLKTNFSGDIDSENWKSLVLSLHPTPATCGLPKVAAQKLISETEKHPRQFYTGFLGPITKTEKTLFVNLRCMEIQGKYAYLYLGGGITAKSIAESEWIETEKKALTLEAVLK